MIYIMKVQLLFFNYIQRCYKLFVSVLLCITICLGVFSQNKQIDMAYDNFNKLYVRGKYIDAKNIGDTIKLKIRNKQTLDYALFLDKYSECLYELEEYDSALSSIKTALKIKKKICGKNSVEYANTLHHKAECLNYMENDKASSIEKKAFQIIKRNEKVNSSTYIEFFLNWCFYNPDYSEIFGLLQKIDKMSLTYVKAISLLSSFYFDEGKYTNSIQLLNEAIYVLEKNEKENHPLYAYYLNDLGHCFYKLGDYSKAFDYYVKSNRTYKESLGVNSINYIYTLTSMANAKAMLGEFGYAKNILNKVSNNVSLKYGKHSSEYASILQIFAFVESKCYNYATTVKYQKEANQILENLYGRFDNDYLLGLSLIASSLSGLGEDNEAGKYAQKLLNLSEKRYGKNSAKYAYALAHCSYLKEDNKKLDLLLKSLEIYSSLKGNYKLDIAEVLRALSDYYIDVCFEKSIEYQTKAMLIYESEEGKESVKYRISLGELAELYYLSGNINKAISYYDDYFLLTKEHLANNLLTLNKDNKFSYLDYYDYALNTKILEVCYYGKELDKATELAFDITLFKKSVLLSSECNIQNLLRRSLESRLTLNNQFSRQIDDNDYNNNLFTAENFNNSLELDTLKTKMLINWRDIQNILSDHDIAIEFEVIPIDDKEKLYCAFILKKEYKTPKILRLFDSFELLKLSNHKEYYNTKDLSQLIWGTLSKELEGIQNIYFAPVEQLYNISIESLPHYKKQGIMSDYYNMYRLSSTRNLVNKRNKTDIKNIIIYGGLNYDSCNVNVSSYTQSLERKEQNYWVSYLPNTKIEIDSIENILKYNHNNAKIEVLKFDGFKGTEESFKSLNNNKINIIHLSTHGFYHKKSNMNFKSNINEDQILTQSGLYMSGVNDVEKEYKDLEDYNNGLLTSYEISNLYFKDLELVVLSACQTGLGLLHYDGVFGLQRAFIKAGANSILMSLWNVDDYATKLLMIEFYRNYISGYTKIQSLLKAQEFIREYKDEYGNQIFEDPYYWAGFILLDALD